MGGAQSHVGNPLTLMAIFAGLSESVGAAVMPLVEPATQATLVWFVMGFPTVLMLMFFATLWYDSRLLYGARDFDTDAARLRFLGVETERAQVDDATRRLQEFWMPGGKVNAENEARLKAWLTRRSLAVPISIFIEGTAHAAEREQAVAELLDQRPGAQAVADPAPEPAPERTE